MKARPRSFVWVLCAALFGCAWGGFVAQAAELRGQVTDSATKLPIEGATVTLDAAPPDGTPESTAICDTFGFYSFTNVPAGSFRVEGRHPAYSPDQADLVFATASARLVQRLELTPIVDADGARFDVVAEVADVTSGVPLARVPVRVERFAQLNDATPADTFLFSTLADGRAAFRGMKRGYFTFRFNHASDGSPRPKWEPFSTPNRVLLMNHHLARAVLKPIPQDLTIRVIGFDPAAGTDGLAGQPLKNVFVELEGVNPADINEVLIPVRVGVTGTNGLALFTGLPAIAWKVKAKRLGYTTTTQLVYPDLNDALPALPLEVTLPIQPTGLIANLFSSYHRALMMTGLVLRVEGLTNSNTEGIRRSVKSVEIPSDPMGPAVAVAEGLVAGTYRLSVTGAARSPMIQSGAFNTTNRFLVRFSAAQTVEVTAGAANEFDLSLEAERANVRVRFHAADNWGNTPLPDPDSGVVGRRPIYQRRALSSAFLKESDLADQLHPLAKTFFFFTDNSGEMLLTLLPGVYGVRIPSLGDYFGSDVQLADTTTGATLRHGWPFDVNLDAVAFANSPHHALGLSFDSGHEYELDLYVRQERYVVHVEAKPDPADPVKQYVVGRAGTNAVVTAITELTSSASGSFTGPGGPSSFGLRQTTYKFVENAPPPNAFFEFSGGPGNYTATFTSPVNTFTSYTGTTNIAFSFPNWGAPGVLDADDAADAAAGVFPFGTRHLVGPNGEPTFTATYGPATDTLRARFHVWNPVLNGGQGEYVLVETRNRPDFFNTDHSFVLCRYVDSGPFKMQARFYDLHFSFPSNVWHTATLLALNNGTEHVVEVYHDGPLQNTTGPLMAQYAFEVRAVSAGDPTMLIPGVKVAMDTGETNTPPFATNAWTGGYLPASVTHPTWAYTGEYDLAFDGLGFVLTVKMKRGMGVSGLIRDVQAGTPIAAARVQVKDRFGRVLRTADTETNGQFVVENAITNAQVVFLDVTAPGFMQQRNRYVPGAEPPDVAATNSLVPITPPIAGEKEFDRFGMFLPGVHKAGNASAYEQFNAQSALTMNWRLRAQEQSFLLSLKQFDTPNGDESGNFTTTVRDSITEVWLVDARSFPDDPQNTEPMALPIPSTNDPPAIRAWLRDIRNGTHANVFHQSVPYPLPGPDGTVEARAPIRLWELPPGEFRPYFVLVTQRGTVALVPLIYSGPDVNKTLRGQRLPPWMAFVADTIGFIAGMQSLGEGLDAEALADLMPAGRFIPLPQFTANINTNLGYLDYEYGLGLTWKEGVDTPGAGLLAFAPSVAGLEFGAGLNFGAEGISNRLYLGVSGDVSGNLPLASMLPARLQRAGELEGGFTIQAGTTAAANYDPSGDPSLFEVLTHVGGNVEASLRVNAKPVTSKIPYVGPVLLALDEVNALRIYGVVTGGIGLDVDNRWRTVFPPSRLIGTGHPELNHVYRRHFLGGGEDLTDPPPVITTSNSLTLCLTFGVGIEARALKDAARAAGFLTLQGHPCGGLNAMTIEPNAFGDWPPIKRISGAVNASLELSLKVWIAEFNRKYEADLLTFDHSFGTEAAFQLVPVTAIGEVLLPSMAEGAAFATSGPDRVKRFYPAGATATTSGALVYTDINPATSNMVLRIVLGNGVQLETPISLAEAGGIVSVAAARLPSGAWMVAWSEIAAADVGNPYPPSTIKYSLSDSNTANWSAPAVVAALSDVALELRLVVSDALTGLVYLHTAEGPLSSRRSIAGAVWDGATWSAPTELWPDAEVLGFDAAGCGGAGNPPALVAWSGGSGALRSLTWNGTNTTGPHTAGTNATDALCLTVASNQFLLAWATEDATVRLARFDDVEMWIPLGMPVTNLFAGEVCVAPLAGTGETLLALAWVDAAAPAELGYAVTDAQGNLERAPGLVAFPDAGRYSNLQLASMANRSARLFARHANGDTSVREFILTSAGVAPWLLNATAAGGTPQFELIASPGQSYRLQGSSNLLHWTDLGSVTPTTSPVLLQNLSAGQHQFYRTVSP